MSSLLSFAARHAKLALVLGLVAGAALPDLALAMRPWIGWMIAGLLFLAALRVGPRQAVGALSDLRSAAGLAVLFQMAFPLAAIGVFVLLDLGGTALATFFVLMLAAPPITGSPNLAAMTGNDPAPALRQLVIGTALVPLTVVPVFWLTPAFGALSAVLGAAAGLLMLIGGATGVAFALRATVFRRPSARAIEALDGLSAIIMAVVVVGLMSAVGPAMSDDPLGLAGLVVFVCVFNFALQITLTLSARAQGTRSANAIGIVGGNRNIALFLSVLPQDVVDPILLYIGCFQIPMYLTPAILGRFYKS